MSATPKQRDFIQRLVEQARPKLADPELDASVKDDVEATLAAQRGPLVDILSGNADAVSRFAVRSLIDDLVAVNKHLDRALAANVVAASAEEVDALLDQLGRKVTVDEVSPAIAAWATEWAKAYEGTFSFMLDMRQAAQIGPLSPGMAKGVVNCYRAERSRSAAAKAPVADVDPGVYVDADQGAFVRVKVSQTGNRYGQVWTGDAWDYRGKDPLRANLRPLTAEEAASWGHHTGSCIFCGLPLEDERSTTAGYGPTCAAKNNLPWGHVAPVENPAPVDEGALAAAEDATWD